MRWVGREEILGLAASAVARSDAFLEEGEARLLSSLSPTWVSSAADRQSCAARDLLGLLEIYARRAHVDEWFMAPGHSPDGLSTRAALGLDMHDANARLQQGSVEAAARAMLEAHGVLSSTGPKLGESRRLAIAVTPPQMPALLRAVISMGGPALQLWMADRPLELRCSLRRSGFAFRAAHPLVHAGLVQRCAKDGIDLA
jgi:hypothetical protein